MNQYKVLLENLLATKTKAVAIKTNVGISSIRKGLRSAINTYNQFADVMEKPTIGNSVSVIEITPNYYNIILLTDEEAANSRFKSKFDFTIVDDSGTQEDTKGDDDG